jgi:hypothetical protein
MKHATTCIALFLAALVFTPALAAQTMQDEIAMTRAEIQADRQAIVAATLDLPEAKGEAFWPMYREYRAEMDVQGDRVWKLLIDFADKYESLSDADASVLLKEWLAIEKKQSDIRSAWSGKFSKAIGAASTARFFQIESKLDSLIRLELTVDVPLAKPAN